MYLEIFFLFACYLRAAKKNYVVEFSYAHVYLKFRCGNDTKQMMMVLFL